MRLVWQENNYPTMCHSLRNEADHDWALQEIARYFDCEPKRDSWEADRFDRLAALIDAYEAEHWPVEPPKPA